MTMATQLEHARRNRVLHGHENSRVLGTAGVHVWMHGLHAVLVQA